jgi:hypothetical protein
MYMNGSHIVSWGIDVDECAKGTVCRGLYKPGENWRQKVDGIDVRAIGIETRSFHFVPGLEGKSIAEDGGLVEVRVFRSDARKRISPRMDDYRSQERYGLA